MVYAAYGVSGLTGIVGTFFVKDYLDLSAEFLAALAFWAGIPWAVKMPVGHVVDLIWRWKAALVWLGAAMIAASLLIMIGLISYFDAMRAVMGGERWFVISALLAPTGYMIQDAVDRSGTFGICRSYLLISGSGPWRSCTSLSERYKVSWRMETQPVVLSSSPCSVAWLR